MQGPHVRWTWEQERKGQENKAKRLAGRLLFRPEKGYENLHKGGGSEAGEKWA